MDNLLTSAGAIAFIVFVWLKTNAFVDFFGRFLKKKNLLYVSEYLQEPDVLRENLFYPLWLYTKHPHFITKLLSCPLCMSFWTNLIFFSNIKEYLFKVYVSLVMFSILNLLYKHGQGTSK